MHNKIETIIGFVVVAVAVIFFMFAYSTVKIKTSDRSYPIKARFTQVEGIVEGSDVLISGIKVGTVTSLKLDPTTYYAVMTFSVSDAIKLPVDSSVKISTNGLLGGKNVSISVGSSSDFLKSGDEIQYTQSSLNLEDLLSKFLFSMSSSKTTTTH